jgi:hypothetical protein
MNARLVNAEAYAHQLQTVTHAHAPKDAPDQLVKMNCAVVSYAANVNIAI